MFYLPFKIGTNVLFAPPLYNIFYGGSARTRRRASKHKTGNVYNKKTTVRVCAIKKRPCTAYWGVSLMS